jgi:hypothetical protein
MVVLEQGQRFSALRFWDCNVMAALKRLRHPKATPSTAAGRAAPPNNNGEQLLLVTISNLV